MEGMLKAFDEVGRRDHGDTWWWNKDVKDVKDAHKEMCKSRTEANRARYKNMKNRAKKMVTKAMEETAEQELRELSEHPNKVFKLVKSIKKDGKDVEGGSCMRGSNGRLNFSEKGRGRVWKEHKEIIMNEENEWDQNVQADLVEGPVERINREEVVKAFGKMRSAKASGPSEVSFEMIAAGGEIGIDVMVELCQSMLDGREMLDECALSVVLPMFKGKGDAMRCEAYSILFATVPFTLA